MTSGGSWNTDKVRLVTDQPHRDHVVPSGPLLTPVADMPARIVSGRVKSGLKMSAWECSMGWSAVSSVRAW
jgi:hypothetical protein